MPYNAVVKSCLTCGLGKHPCQDVPVGALLWVKGMGNRIAKGKDRHCRETESELITARERGWEKSHKARGDLQGDSSMI